MKLIKTIIINHHLHSISISYLSEEYFLPPRYILTLSSASLPDEITKMFWFSWLKIQFNSQHHKLNYISEINDAMKLGSSPQLPTAAAALSTLTVLLTAQNLIWLKYRCIKSYAGTGFLHYNFITIPFQKIHSYLVRAQR